MNIIYFSNKWIKKKSKYIHMLIKENIQFPILMKVQNQSRVSFGMQCWQVPLLSASITDIMWWQLMHCRNYGKSLMNGCVVGRGSLWLKPHFLIHLKLSQDYCKKSRNYWKQDFFAILLRSAKINLENLHILFGLG